MLYDFWKNRPPLSRFFNEKRKTNNEKRETMTILFKITNIEGNITLGEDANIEECVDAYVAAMIAQGYSTTGIIESFRAKANYLETSADKYC